MKTRSIENLTIRKCVISETWKVQKRKSHKGHNGNKGHKGQGGPEIQESRKCLNGHKGHKGQGGPESAEGAKSGRPGCGAGDLRDLGCDGFA